MIFRLRPAQQVEFLKSRRLVQMGFRLVQIVSNFCSDPLATRKRFMAMYIQGYQTTGKVDRPRKVKVLRQSSSSLVSRMLGRRLIRADKAISPSKRARGAPRQW